ncbi:hypothetical protein BJX62DRAFT_23788 [Aspergillus germanicus]
MARGSELSPYTRAFICGMAAAGCTRSKISKELALPSSTIQYTLHHDPQRNDGKLLQRSGRPLKLSARDQQ